MAVAVKEIVKEERLAMVDVSKITLELDMDEAQALTDVLACIGGDPRKSDRKHTASILDSLHGVGMHWRNLGPSHQLDGGLRFSDWPEEER